MSDRKNIFWLLILNIVSVASQFLVYRVIFKSLGADQMGIWSLLTAATTLGLISNFGLGTGLIKYTAESVLRKDNKHIQLLAGTANLSSLLISLPLVFLFFQLSIMFAKPILLIGHQEQFKQILPYCMVSLYLNNIASTFASLLDGYRRFNDRCIIQLVGFAVYAGFSMLLIDHFGLIAIAYALCAQSVFVLVASIYTAYKRGITANIFPIVFRKDVFKKLIYYGIKFQLINILVFLFDPLVKFFITKNFGLASTGTYELANKLVIQVRTVVVNLLQVMVPQISTIKDQVALNSYMASKLDSNSFLAINASIATLFMIPVASFFFIGSISFAFVVCSLVMLLAWLGNMLTAPFYFACLGLEKLNILIYQHLIYSAITILFFPLLSSFINSTTVFVIPALALVAGSFFLWNQARYFIEIRVKVLINKYQLYIYLFCLGFVLFLIFATKPFLLLVSVLAGILICWFLLLARSAELRTIFGHLKNHNP